MIDTGELRKSANAVFLAVEEDIAHDLSDKLNKAANEIDNLRNMLAYMVNNIGQPICLETRERFAEAKNLVPNDILFQVSNARV